MGRVVGQVPSVVERPSCDHANRHTSHATFAGHRTLHPGNPGLAQIERLEEKLRHPIDDYNATQGVRLCLEGVLDHVVVVQDKRRRIQHPRLVVGLDFVGHPDLPVVPRFVLQVEVATDVDAVRQRAFHVTLRNGGEAQGLAVRQPDTGSSTQAAVHPKPKRRPRRLRVKSWIFVGLRPHPGRPFPQVPFPIDLGKDSGIEREQLDVWVQRGKRALGRRKRPDLGQAVFSDLTHMTVLQHGQGAGHGRIGAGAVPRSLVHPALKVVAASLFRRARRPSVGMPIDPPVFARRAFHGEVGTRGEVVPQDEPTHLLVLGLDCATDLPRRRRLPPRLEVPAQALFVAHRQIGFVRKHTPSCHQVDLPKPLAVRHIHAVRHRRVAVSPPTPVGRIRRLVNAIEDRHAGF